MIKRYAPIVAIFAFLAAIGGFSFYLYHTYLSSGASSSRVAINRGPVVVDKKFPTFHAKDIENVDFDLSAAPKKLRVVNFWASWCEPCLSEIPSLFSLAKQLHESLEIIAISEDNSLQDVRTAMRVFPNMSGVSVRVIYDFDKSLSSAYAVSGLPESFIISPEGLLLKHVVGSLDWLETDVMKFFDGLIKSQSAK